MKVILPWSRTTPARSSLKMIRGTRRTNVPWIKFMKYFGQILDIIQLMFFLTFLLGMIYVTLKLVKIVF